MEIEDPLLQAALAAKGLRVGLSPGKGRGLFAARSFSRGDMLLEQDAYVAVLAENGYTRCDGCFQEGMQHQICPSCKIIRYCGSSCERREQSIHSEECKGIVKVTHEQGRTLTPSMRLMLRLLIKRKLQEEGILPVDAFDNYRMIEALPTHIQDIMEQRYILYAQMAILVKSVYSFEDTSIKDIAHSFGRFSCNAHTICDEELRPLGTGLYTVLSIINHSCTPNVVLVFEGKHAVVRAIEPIDEGMEVTASYVDLGAITSARRSALKEQYFFDCDCPRCSKQVSESGMDIDLLEDIVCPNKKCKGLLAPESLDLMMCRKCNGKISRTAVYKIMEEIEASSTEVKRHLSLGNTLDAKGALEKLYQLQARVFHQSSIQRLKTYDDLLKVCMSLEDWSSALKYCHQSLPAYEKAYLPYHPLLGLQFYTCGKLEWLMGKTEEALKFYKRALDILQVTYGSRSELVNNLKSSLAEAEAEASFLR